MTDLEINYNINFKDVLVIDENGTQLGVMSRDAAINKAEERDLDLVLVAKNNAVPTCKFMDYGKYRFNQLKKEKESKKNQKTTETSEVQISLTIQQHDMETKAAMVKRLIDKGNQVRVVLRLRGREISMSDSAITKINQFALLCAPFSKIKKEAILEGKDVKLFLEKK